MGATRGPVGAFVVTLVAHGDREDVASFNRPHAVEQLVETSG